MLKKDCHNDLCLVNHIEMSCPQDSSAFAEYSQHTKHIFCNKCKDCASTLASSHMQLVSGPLHFHHGLVQQDNRVKCVKAKLSQINGWNNIIIITNWNCKAHRESRMPSIWSLYKVSNSPPSDCSVAVLLLINLSKETVNFYLVSALYIAFHFLLQLPLTVLL